MKPDSHPPQQTLSMLLAIVAAPVFLQPLLADPAVTATKTDAHPAHPHGRAEQGDTITYTVTITNNGTTDANGVTLTDPTPANTTLVPGSVNTSPIARNDVYSATGNVSISHNAATGLLANDTDADGDTLTVTGVNSAGTQGNVSFNADGSFTFDPAAGFEGQTTFTYTVSDGKASDTATVTINVSGMIWFVNNAAGSGNGRLSSPFNSLAAFQAVNNGSGTNPKANHNVFIYESGVDYVGPVTLLNGQRLIGQDSTATLATIAGITPPAGSAALPAMNSGNGTVARLVTVGSGVHAVTLGSNNTLRGFTIGNTSGAAVSGSNFGTLTTNDLAITGSGQTLNLSSGTLAAAFSGISSTSSSATGMTLTSVGGSLTSGATTIASSTGIGVHLSGSSANLVFGALNITPPSGQRGLLAQNHTGAISSTSGTISTTNAVAVEITGVSSANRTPLDMQLTAVNANGGANGILLTNTSASGSPGGFRVVGTGAANSGGTITNMTGADGAVAGSGIHLSGASNISLTRMHISSCSNHGIYGVSVRGLVLDFLTTSGNLGTSNSGQFNECSVRMVDLGGVVSVTNSTLNGGAMNALRIDNGIEVFGPVGTNPNLALTLSNNTVSLLQGSVEDVRGTALLVNVHEGTMTAKVENNNITFWWGNAIHVLVQGSASGTSRITGNTANNTNGALAGAGGIWVAGGQHHFEISNNTVRNTDGTAISADRTTAGALMQGTIANNTIGVSGVANSGSNAGSGVFASHHGPGTTTIRIADNIIRQINGSAGVRTVTGDAAGFGGSGVINATITGNNIQESGTSTLSARMGILITHGATSSAPGDTDLGRYDIQNNVVTNFNMDSASTAQNRIRVNQRFGTTSQWPGYTGAALGTDSATQLGAYLSGRNTISNVTNTNSSTGGFINTIPAGSAVPQPDPVVLAMHVNESEAARMAANSDSPDNPITATVLLAPEESAAPLDTASVSPEAVPTLDARSLERVVNMAVETWEASGLTEEQLTAMRNVRFEIARLRGWHIGEANSEVVRLDWNAKGYGWFVDPETAGHDPFPADAAMSPEGSPAATRMDLLTAVMHELGHVAGLPDSYDEESRDSIMYGYLVPGERRMAKAGDAAGAVPSSDLTMRSLTAPINIGNLPAGKTVTVTFQVTVNNPVPAGTTQITSQGTVSGSNFANVLTDDPDVAGASNPTVTLLGIPASVTSAATATFQTGAAGIFTVTANGSPVPGLARGGVLLPDGVTFSDNGDGTGTLGGTPAAGTGGTYEISFTAANGVGTDAVQNFTLTVNQPPAFTSGDAVTFHIGQAGNFAVTASGFPVPAFGRSGALPAGVTFTDNDNGSATLGGTPDAGTAGTYNLVFTATNGTGAPEQNFTLTVNTPPVAGSDTLGTMRDQTVSASFAKLLVNDSDADGDPLSITAVSAATAQGGAAAINGASILYTPPAGYIGADSFTYTLSDGRGGLAQGAVSVTVGNPDAIPNQGTVTPTANGFLIRFHGIPTAGYKIQFSPDLSPGSWQDLTGTLQAGPNGVYEFEDTTDPMPPQRFYRGVSVP